MEEHSFGKTRKSFQKVHVTAKRAKSLYELDEPSKASFSHKLPSRPFLNQMREGSNDSSASLESENEQA